MEIRVGPPLTERPVTGELLDSYKVDLNFPLDIDSNTNGMIEKLNLLIHFPVNCLMYFIR